MTPQERQLVDDLFDRLSKIESAPRDPEALAAISDGSRKAPNALYALVQTVLVQDEALKRANDRIQELESAHAPQQQSGGFLDSMRETIFGASQSRGSVPNVPPPGEAPNRPVWNSGQAMQQAQPGSYGPGSYGSGSYNQPYGGPPVGAGGSFLGTAAAAAAGVVGGSLLLNSIRSMMGGQHHSFGDAAAADRSGSPWSDQSGGTLARDAGLNDIDSGSGRQDTSRSGLFDQTSNNDDQAANYTDDRDDGDFDSDGFDEDDGNGNDGDSDYA